MAAAVLVASSLSLSGAASTASAADTASISGVLTSTGAPAQPVSFGTVRAFHADGSPAGTTPTNANGAYSVTGLSAGSYTLQFSGGFNSGLVPQWWNQQSEQSSAISFAVGDGEALAGFDAQLQLGATVSGRVISASTPTVGLAGANVLITDASRSVVGSTVSASDGSFSVNGLAAGMVTIDARSPFDANFLEQWWSGKTSFETADFFPVSAGDVVSDRNIALLTGATISGSVRTRTAPQAPLVSATVSAFGPDGTIQFQGTSDQSGNYTIAGLAPGSYRILFQSAESENFGSSWWHRSTSFATATVVDVASGQVISGINGELDAGGTISGTVIGVGGGALADYFIEPVDAAGASVPVGLSLVDGVFTISHLAPGSYTLHAYTFGGDLAEQWWNGASSLANATYFSIAAGETLAGFTFTLAPPGIVGATPTISGTATVGQTLTAATGAWTPASVSFSYQWLRNGVAIVGAISPALSLANADLGATISVAVTASEPGFSPVTVISDPTGPVGSPTVSSATPTVTGSTRVGKTLTAHAGAGARHRSRSASAGVAMVFTYPAPTARGTS